MTLGSDEADANSDLKAYNVTAIAGGQGTGFAVDLDLMMRETDGEGPRVVRPTEGSSFEVTFAAVACKVTLSRKPLASNNGPSYRAFVEKCRV